MNIQVQCCGLAILFLLWIFYLSQKPLGLYSVKMFLITMGMTTFCVSMDILSIIAIHHMEQIPRILLALICKTYIVSLIWVGYFGLLYSGTELAKTRYGADLCSADTLLSGRQSRLYLWSKLYGNLRICADVRSADAF